MTATTRRRSCSPVASVHRLHPDRSGELGTAEDTIKVHLRATNSDAGRHPERICHRKVESEVSHTAGKGCDQTGYTPYGTPPKCKFIRLLHTVMVSREGHLQG